MTSLLKIFIIITILTVCYGKPPTRCGGPHSHSNPYPFVVSINIDKQHSCGGTIINERWIITSASCVVNKVSKPYENLAIITALSSTSNYRIAYTVDDIFIGKNYEPENITSSDDLALIKLVHPIRLNYHVDKILLSKSPPSNGYAAFTPGWSRLVAPSVNITSEFIPVLLNTTTADACSSYTTKKISTDKICGQGLIRNKGVCAGDNGNPLILFNQLIGVASGKVACGSSESDLFTSVYYYYDWIEGYISGKTPLPTE